MWYVYSYLMCIYYLSNFITSKSISPPRSDLALGKFCFASDAKSVCAQIYSPLSDGPFYEPLGRLRRHMEPNGFNTNKLIKRMQQNLINIPYREIYCRRNLTAVVQSVMSVGGMTSRGCHFSYLYYTRFHSIQNCLGDI